MGRLSSFDGKRVRIKDPDGKIWSGLVLMYSYPDENDEGVESITIEITKDKIYEFYPDDIVEIETI